MVPVVTLVESLLSLHAGGYAGVEVVGNFVKINDSPHNGRGVFCGVQDARDQHGFILYQRISRVWASRVREAF